MKVWMLLHEGEGMPTEVRLYAEDKPPSTKDIYQDMVTYFGLSDSEANKQCFIVAEKGESDLSWESVCLTLESVICNS